MTKQAPSSPATAITEAIALIEATYPALPFADERAADEAGESFRRALRICRYQLRRATSAQVDLVSERTEGGYAARDGHRDGQGT